MANAVQISSIHMPNKYKQKPALIHLYMFLLF